MHFPMLAIERCNNDETIRNKAFFVDTSMNKEEWDVVGCCLLT